MREKVSLLLSNGHIDAANYPLGMVRDEYEIVSLRINRTIASEALVAQAAMGTVAQFATVQSAKKAWSHFQKMIAGLTGE